MKRTYTPRQRGILDGIMKHGILENGRKRKRARLPYMVIIDDHTRVKFQYTDIIITSPGATNFERLLIGNITAPEMYFSIRKVGDRPRSKYQWKKVDSRFDLDDVLENPDGVKGTEDSTKLRNSKLYLTYDIFHYLPQAHPGQHRFHGGIKICDETVHWPEFLKLYEYVFEASGLVDAGITPSNWKN